MPKIGQYPNLGLASTSKFLTDTGAAYSSNTLQDIVNYTDGKYQQLGEVKFESETGDVSGSFTPETGHLYKIYVNTGCDNDREIYGKQVLSVIFEAAADIPVTILNIQDEVYGYSSIRIHSLGFSVSVSIYALKVYKIIDMGVAQ